MRARMMESMEGRSGVPPPLLVPRMPGSVVEVGGREIERRGVGFDLDVEGVVEEDFECEDTTGPAIEA